MSDLFCLLSASVWALFKRVNGSLESSGIILNGLPSGSFRTSRVACPECAIGHGIGRYRPYSISVPKLLWIGRRLRQEGIMPLLRSLPEQPIMRDLYKSQPASCDGRLLPIGFASGEVPSLPMNLPLLKNYSIV
jgi:hypothetical protein